MAIIAFTWTTAALLARAKSRTRRNWDAAYAARFRFGMRMDAWDRSPLYGGIFLGFILLTGAPFQELTGEMAEDDYEVEGLAWMERNGMLIRKQPPREFFENWKRENEGNYIHN
jgi:hypothetical protein